MKVITHPVLIHISSFISIFAPDMKRFRYIFAVILSLTIIYVGAGVSVVHYCCAACETAQSCCSNGCPKCRKSHQQPDKSCNEEGCTATIYKVDLMKHSCEASVNAPVIQLFCGLLPQLRNILYAGEWQETSYNVPPPPVSSRHYLALYSVLLI